MPQLLTILSSKTFWIGLAVAVGIAICAYFLHTEYKAGENKEVVIQQKAQIQQDITLRKEDAKVDQVTPYSSGKPAAINWLRNYTNR